MKRSKKREMHKLLGREDHAVLEIGKLAISAMLDSQPSLSSYRTSHLNWTINRTTPGELEEIIHAF